MASHVIVVHTTARTAKINTTPGKHLSDIRDEACQKFNVNPDQYTLKYNNKPINLSQPFRLAYLPQGARLNLVQFSKSPTAISVALQLPESEKSVRLTNKFASNTSLWQILRYFESANGANYNFTQRGVPELSSNNASGAGRLNYEMPVIHVMPSQREHASFVQLQKTLAQLGFDNGSALLKLSFKNSGTPLEEAMAEISQYFKRTEEPAPETAAACGAHAGSVGQMESAPEPGRGVLEATKTVAGLDSQNDPPEPIDIEPTPTPTQPSSTPSGPTNGKEIAASSTLQPASPETPMSDSTVVGSSNHRINILLPPSSSTPQAARTAHNDADYIPTIEHAKLHQASLQNRGRNTRLLSDKELAEEEATRESKLAEQAEKGTTVRIRLPDQSQIEVAMSKLDTGKSLYELVRMMIRREGEKFQLRYTGPKGQQVSITDETQRLIQDLKFGPKELVTFAWDENASFEARKAPTLKDEWVQKGQKLEVREVAPEPEPEEKKSGNILGAMFGKGKEKSQESRVEKEKRLFNRFMGKGFGKK